MIYRQQQRGPFVERDQARVTYERRTLDANSAISFLVLLAAYVLCGVFLALKMPTDLEPVIAANYATNVIAYFIMTGAAVGIFAKRGFDVFDPFLLVSVTYIPIFTAAPIHDIIVDDYYHFGVNTMVYGVKGTVIAVVGYLAFCSGYLLRWASSPSRPARHATHPPTNVIAGRSLLIWAFAFSVTLLSLMASGKGATYILSLGLIGDADARPTMDASVGFGTTMAHVLIPTAILVAYSVRSRWLAAIVQLLTLTLIASQGFRYIVVIFVLSHIYVWYMKRGTRPRLATMALWLAVLIIFSGVMEFYRGALRTGGSAQWSQFDGQDILDAVFGNLGIYKTYYGVIHAVPDLVPYGLGAQMVVYTAVMFVPRLFWPDKPLPPTWDPIRAGVSNYAAKAGAAYPNIGEYYFEFGVIGVVVLMGLLGFGAATLTRRFRHSENILDLVLYAVVTTSLFQLVIRGYTPSNFYMVLFLFLPVLAVGRCSSSASGERIRAPFLTTTRDTDETGAR